MSISLSGIKFYKNNNKKYFYTLREQYQNYESMKENSMVGD